MTGFTDQLVESNRDLWAAMAGHPFVLGLADGTLPDRALQAWVQQDRIFIVQERRVLAALRAHVDHSLVLEAEAFARTAADHGVAAEAEPWPVCLGYTSYLRCAAHDGALEGLTALYAAERAYLDTWTAVAKLSPADSTYHPWIQNWTGEPFRAFVGALGRDLDELAGAPSPALAHRLGMLFTGAARFELAFWEMCWSGWAWPG
jgi:thiaminase/transcriptional activator TenA